MNCVLTCYLYVNTYSPKQAFLELFYTSKCQYSLFSKKNPIIQISAYTYSSPSQLIRISVVILFFFCGATALPKPRLPHCWCFEITHRHTTLGRIPLNEGSARRRDLYQTTHNIHKTQTPMLPVWFEPAIPANERPQTYALDHTASGIGMKFVLENGNETRNCCLSAEGRRSLKRCTCRWEDNIKMNHADTLCGGVKWSEIHHNGIQWWPIWTP